MIFSFWFLDLSAQNYNGSDPLYAKLEQICGKLGISVIKVWNKLDIYRSGAPSGYEGGSAFYVSALSGEGIESLRTGLLKAVLASNVGEASVVVTSARHRDALSRARKSLEYALDTLRSGKSGEFVALDLRAGLNALGEITGEITSEDILNNIFSKFCIGK